jgi:CrcB protein
MSSGSVWVAVAAAGGCGALLRLLVDEAIRGRTAGAFAYGILVVNVSGSLLLGILTGTALPHDTALIAATAFVGAYTTFSTWMLDTVSAAAERLATVALLNIGLSLALGLAAAAIGRAIGLDLR